MTGKVHWTKTGLSTNPALTVRAEPCSARAIGIPTDFVGGTFETIADEMNGEKMNEKILETMNDNIGIKTKDVPCGTKSPRQLIADTELNDTTVITAVTKNNANGVGRDCPPNDAALDHIDSDADAACQEHQGRQECQFSGTGMCIQ